MPHKQNTLHPKPHYTIHRSLVGTPAVADSGNLNTLYQLHSRGAINCKGWETVQGFVVIEGGSTPTVTLAALELVKCCNAFPGFTDEDNGFILSIGGSIGPLSPGAFFEVQINQGMLFMRVAAFAGNPTALRVYITGGKRGISHTGQQ